MTCSKCVIAKRAFMGLAKLMPREEIQMLGVVCRYCNMIWTAIPKEEK